MLRTLSGHSWHTRDTRTPDKSMAKSRQQQTDSKSASGMPFAAVPGSAAELNPFSSIVFNKIVVRQMLPSQT